MADGDRKREQALPPGTYAYVLDGTKGSIKTHAGPCTLTLTNQDKPVRFNTTTFKFEECSLEDAVQQNIVAPEGFYVELRNPAKQRVGGGRANTGDAQPVQLVDVHPEPSRANETPDFQVGEKENIPGPVSFALYPGQMAEVRRGHHLRLNEYLRIKIYNDDKAKANWSKAVVKTAEGETPAAPVTSTKAPTDLALGKQYNIVGKEVSFYIPPTGVSVVPEEASGEFVRDAETLEQLEYSILVDEDGNKEYPRGPAVVFPRPTQQFLKDTKQNRKFRAVELNELQGIQLKFTKDVELTFADGTKHQFRAGDEVFITGKEMPIYFPEEGHQLVRYDGKTIHYASAVPEGEARYVMNRKTGEIRTVEGPCMLLPNPVTEIIVRRALSDAESIAMFPGPDGLGSREALEFNRMLRQLAGAEPTTRQGVVSEGSLERNAGAQMNQALDASLFYANTGPQASAGGFDAIDSAAMAFSNAAESRGAKPRRMAKGTMVEESRQGKHQEAMLGDVAERKSTYNEPRTLTFANKFRGVPTIRVQQGYAVQVADSDGSRKVVEGPATLLLDYAESLDVLSLSTGKPKNTDRLFRTAYLNVKNNKVSDIIEVETIDHVKVRVKLAYNVNFEGDSSKWFTIENYVKHMCDHVRSVLKGRTKKQTIEAFYNTATDFIRDNILGTAKLPDATNLTGSPRPGMAFPENGMRVTDVEVLGVEIVDTNVANLLSQSQQQVVQQNIQLAQAKQRLEMVMANEDLSRQEAEAKSKTVERKLQLEAMELQARLTLDLDKIGAEIQKRSELEKQHQADEAIKTFVHQQDLARQAAQRQLHATWADDDQKRWLTQIQTQTKAVAEQMKSIDPNLSAALMSVAAQETLAKVAHELSFHQILGGENAVDVLRKVFANTPLEALMAKVIGTAGALGANGSSTTKSASPVS